MEATKVKALEVRYNPYLNTAFDDILIVNRQDGVVVWCNHLRYETREVDAGYADAIIGDWVDRTINLVICLGCGATRRPGEQHWEEV